MPGFELFGDEERKQVQDVLSSGILMRYGFDDLRQGHWKAKELEKEITHTFDVDYAQLTYSGTTALSTALACLGIGHGDEVILPTFTFVASFEAVVLAGANPVFVDIDETLGLDPKAVEKAITPNTKAVMVVHMCGGMARLKEIKVLCQQYGILLIEDACQSIGGSYEGKKLGTIGDIGVFSFDFVKTITCGEGGVLMTNSQEYYTKADQYTDHGHDHLGQDRGAESHPYLGYNFRISELHAAVGLGQIKKLASILSIQRKFNAMLKALLSANPSISFRTIPDLEGDNASFLSFFLPSESLARKAHAALLDKGIGGNFYWYDNNWHYIKKWQHLRQARSLFPLHPSLEQALISIDAKQYQASDSIMSRTISSLISLSWTEEQARRRFEAMAEVIQSVCS